MSTKPECGSIISRRRFHRSKVLRHLSSKPNKLALRPLRRRAPKSDPDYTYADIEAAVHAVLCGKSVADAAEVHCVSESKLKQALKTEEQKRKSGAMDDEFGSSPLPAPISGLEQNSYLNGDLNEERKVHFLLPKKNKFIRKDLPNLKNHEEINVTCGNLPGKLIMNKFLCPGVHHECIQLEEGRLITPKEFTILGGKASLKNWKTAIRVDKVALRFYLDSGSLEFYKHDEHCSGKCLHRKSLPPMNRMEYNNAEIFDVRVEVDEDGSTEEVDFEHISYGENDGQQALSALVVDEDLTEKGAKKIGQSSIGIDGAGQKLINRLQIGQVFPVKLSSVPTTASTSGSLLSIANSGHELASASMPDIETMMEDGVKFWQGIVDIGLLEEFFVDVKKKLSMMLADINRTGLTQEVADVLTELVTKLHLTTKLKYKLSSHQQEVEQEKRKIAENINSLKLMMEVEEQKHFALRRKSERLDSFLSSKRPRLSNDVTQSSSDGTLGTKDGGQNGNDGNAGESFESHSPSTLKVYLDDGSIVTTTKIKDEPF